MTKFKVGDKVQLTVESIEYYENDKSYQDFITPWEWEYLYSGLTIDSIDESRDPVLYAIKETNIGFYEFELERDQDV